MTSNEEGSKMLNLMCSRATWGQCRATVKLSNHSTPTTCIFESKNTGRKERPGQGWAPRVEEIDPTRTLKLWRFGHKGAPVEASLKEQDDGRSC
jgi:hypothetical protein